MALTHPVKRADHFTFPAAKFRTKQRPTHGGIDFTPVVQGKPEPVYAIESGTIVISGFSKNAGNNIMILADSGRRWWYGHLSRRDVSYGQRVKQGQVLGMTGTTGNSDGVHLHLELHHPSINIENDPWPWIWNAPDVDGDAFMLAESREEALVKYKEGLSMADIESINKKLDNIAERLKVPGAPYDWLPAINNKLDVQTKTLNSTVKILSEQAKAQGVTLDLDALASELIENGLPEAIVLEMVEQTRA